MKFVLNDQIWRTQWRVFDCLRGREITTLHMRVGVLDFGRSETMSRTEAVYLPEEHLRLALPRHLCELIHSRDYQGGHQPVNLFINDENWQPFFRRIPRSEKALPERVAAIDERPTPTLPVNLNLNVSAGVYLRTTPWACSQLCWRSQPSAVPEMAVRLLDGLGALVSCVRSCSIPDPQPNSKRSLAPLFLVARLPTNVLTCTNQSGSALELLNGQQPQGVPHQNSNAVL